MLAATIAIALWYWLARPGNALVSALLALATLAGVVASLVLLSGWTSSLMNGGRQHRAVDTVTRTITPAAAGRPAGTLIGDDGDAAEARVDHETLSVTGLDEAGTYTGSVDPAPAVPGSDIKITATVRDWWPYTLIAVAAGVFVGWVISRSTPRAAPNPSCSSTSRNCNSGSPPRRASGCKSPLGDGGHWCTRSATTPRRYSPRLATRQRPTSPKPARRSRTWTST